MLARLTGMNNVLRNLNTYVNSTVKELEAVSSDYAKAMQAYSKANRPWTDRTGNARRGLFGYVLSEPTRIRTRIAHQVHYGVYLELGFQGRFAILQPTVSHYIADYYRDVERVVRGR
jgi:hypothetical protein